MYTVKDRHGLPYDLRWDLPPSKVTVRDANTMKVLRVEDPDGTPAPLDTKPKILKNRRNNSK